MAGIKSLQETLRKAQGMGRNGDTLLAHINPREAAMLKKMGGSGTINPRTGLLQFDDEGDGGDYGGDYGGTNDSWDSAEGAATTDSSFSSPWSAAASTTTPSDSVGSGGGSNQSLNAAMGSQTPDQRDATYGGGGGGPQNEATTNTPVASVTPNTPQAASPWTAATTPAASPWTAATTVAPTTPSVDTSQLAARQQAEKAAAEAQAQAQQKALQDRAAAEAQAAADAQAKAKAASDAKAAADAKALQDRAAAETQALADAQAKADAAAAAQAQAERDKAAAQLGIIQPIDFGNFGIPGIVVASTNTFAPKIDYFGSTGIPTTVSNLSPTFPSNPYTSMFMDSGTPETKPTRNNYTGDVYGHITPTVTNLPSDMGSTFSGPKGALPMTDKARFAGYGVSGSIPDFKNLESNASIPSGTLAKLMGVESTYGTNPKALNLTSGPSGPFQMTEDVGRKYGIVGTGFDLRNDPVASAQAAAAYASDIAKDLKSTLGREPTPGEIGLGYNQGSAGARALLDNPDMSAAEALSSAYGGNIDKAIRAIKNNGGDPDASAKKFSDKISQTYQNMPSESPTLVAGLQNLATGVGTAVGNLAKAALSAPASFADTLQNILDSNKTTAPSNIEAGAATLPTSSPASAFLGTSDQVMGFAVPGTDQIMPPSYRTDYAGNPISAPQGEINWSKGDIPGIDNSKYKETIYNQPNPNFPDDPEVANSVTGDTPESYAQKFGINVSDVQSRITNMNGFPQVEFFAKGLDQVFGDMAKDITSIPAKVLSGITSAADAATKIPTAFNNWLTTQLDSTSSTGMAPEVSGNSNNNIDTGTPTPVTQTTTPTTSVETTTPPVTKKGITPVNTDMDLSGVGSLYRGNPLVQTTSIAYPDYYPV